MRIFCKLFITFFMIYSLVTAEVCHEQTGWCFVQSTSQAFYMFDNVTIGGYEIIPGEWEGSPPGECPFNDCDVVAAFNGETCVAWSYYYKVNDVFTLVLMGADGLTGGAENYLYNGDYPTFKIYQAESGNYYNAVIETGVPMFTNFGNSSIEEMIAEEDADGNVLSIESIIELYDFVLYEPYPNPFNPVTAINYDLPEEAHVSLIVYDILGKNVQTLVNHSQSAGSYSLDWQADVIPSGVYFVRMLASNKSFTQKVMVLK